MIYAPAELPKQRAALERLRRTDGQGAPGRLVCPFSLAWTAGRAGKETHKALWIRDLRAA